MALLVVHPRGGSSLVVALVLLLVNLHRSTRTNEYAGMQMFLVKS